MISAVAFCPQAPVLVPDLAQGAAAELDDVRAACRAAIGRLAAPGRQLVVLGGGARDAFHGPTSRGSFAGFGLDLEVPLGSDGPGPTELPPSLTVAAWLLRDALGPDCGAVAYEIADPFTTDGDWGEHGDDLGVLVMGDGSARRSLKAPGYLDDRAEDFDRGLAVALAGGAGGSLHLWEAGLAHDLLASCAGAYELVSWSLEPFLYDAELLHESAPYGVGYFVASWALDRSSARG